MTIHKALHGDGTKRIRPGGCWSFCGKPGECPLEKVGACRKFVPRIECGPPNQGVGNIYELMFGKGDYEKEITEYRKARLKAKKAGISPPNWRPRDDPHALIPINMDPRKFIDGKIVVLWDAVDFQNRIFNSREVILAVKEAGKHDVDPFTTVEFGELRGSLIGLFNSAYGNTGTGEEAVYLFVSSGAEIVATWLLEQYCTDQMFWLDLFLRLDVGRDVIVPDSPSCSTSGMSFFTGTGEEFAEVCKQADRRNSIEGIEDARRKEAEKRRRANSGFDFA